MCKKLLLIFIILTTSLTAQSNLLCKKAFKEAPISKEIHEVVFLQIDKVIDVIEKLELFERSNRKRQKEIKHMKEDLEGIKKTISSRLKSNDYLYDFLKKWEDFNDYWLEKALEFESLPKDKQKQLKEYLDLPLSLSTKHFISFFEAKNHTKWKLNRLNSFLLLHKSSGNIDVEAALFLFNRQVLKFYSRWDYTKCKY